MSGEKAKHLTESLGQRDSDLFQQLGVSTVCKKKEKLEKTPTNSDDSVNTYKRKQENVINHLRFVAKTKVRSKHYLNSSQ